MKRFASALVVLGCLAVHPTTADASQGALKATELSNGVPVGNLSASQGNWIHFTIALPVNASDLLMQIYGGSGDADLYTRFGAQPTTSSYDCRPYKWGNDEDCRVASPRVGTYYVSIRAYSAFSGVTVKASFKDGGTPPSEQELTNGQAVSVSGSQGDWRHFFIKVPADATSLTMQMSGGSGDGDLYTRFGARPTSSTYDCRPYKSGNNETCTVSNPQTGNYYLSVHGYSAFSGASLKATYQSGPGPGDKTFIITAVYDNLDNQDMYILASGLEGLGYTKTIEDTNVSSSELTSYLAMNVTTIYHTGHGNSGSVATSDGSISYSGVTLNAVNTFFATCLTLVPTQWKNRFGSNADVLMGYTKVSYDYTDNTVAQNMTNELGNNRTYPVAWYLANAGISSLSDRWAEYVREGSSIVEYSARTGNIPSYATLGDAWLEVEDSGRVRVAPELAVDTRTFQGAFGNMVDVHSADTLTFAEPAGLALLGAVDGGQEHAQALATEWLSDLGGVPSDAVLDRVVPIKRRESDSTPYEIVGYSFHYRREVGGVAIGGNRAADHLTILVGADAVVAASRYWPAITTGPATDMSASLLGVQDAISLAADEIRRAVKGTGPIHLVEVEPVYGTRGPNQGDSRLHPAYQVLSAEGMQFVIDAQTGELLL